MQASITNESIPALEPTTPAPVPESAAKETTGAAHIDLALVSGDQILVIGWILDFPQEVKIASISFGDSTIDLLSKGIRVPRSDVARHFRKQSADTHHGFYFLADLPPGHQAISELRLTYFHLSGDSHESLWPIKDYFPIADSIHQTFASTFIDLVRSLPRHEVKRLVKFVSPEHRSKLALAQSSILPPPAEIETDLCCLIEDHFLVIAGSLVDPTDEVKTFELKVGGVTFDFLAEAIPAYRRSSGSGASCDEIPGNPRLANFLFAKALATEQIPVGELQFSINSNTDNPVLLTRNVTLNAHQARKQVLTFLDGLDGEPAIKFGEALVSKLSESQEMGSFRRLLDLCRDRAISRLPPSFEDPNQETFLHLDSVLPIGSRGIYLSGWHATKSGESEQIAFHSGDASYPISQCWVRYQRMDVAAYLANRGVQRIGYEHGFFCLIPSAIVGRRPCYVSLSRGSGETRLLGLPKAEKSSSALQTVRSILSSIDPEHRQMRALLDKQIGPAVQAAWSARERTEERGLVETFGTKPADPEVSIIVPLYGRCDFAEYQIALFADDSDLRRADLIYVVDDPAIIQQFRSMCEKLLGVYGVPFTVAFPGANLGYAGANNFGVRYASGTRLLFLNSDVLPKRRGWISEMVRIYSSLDQPGMLGAKLLYEDGSIQHAGISFRRLPQWGGLWINDHPMKGQDPSICKGTAEVPAVTAACAMIDAKLFRELGGLSEDYIIGDFEDSDLCLRARQAGRRNYVARDIELFHLERQSQQLIGDASWRQNLTAYNCWLHNQKWAPIIEEIDSGTGSSQSHITAGFDNPAKQQRLATKAQT